MKWFESAVIVISLCICVSCGTQGDGSSNSVPVAIGTIPNISTHLSNLYSVSVNEGRHTISPGALFGYESVVINGELTSRLSGSLFSTGFITFDLSQISDWSEVKAASLKFHVKMETPQNFCWLNSINLRVWQLSSNDYDILKNCYVESTFNEQTQQYDVVKTPLGCEIPSADYTPQDLPMYSSATDYWAIDDSNFLALLQQNSGKKITFIIKLEDRFGTYNNCTYYVENSASDNPPLLEVTH